MLSFSPRGVLDEILNLIESVSEVSLPTLVNTCWGSNNLLKITLFTVNLAEYLYLIKSVDIF